MSSSQPERMRASDEDRQAIVELLRAALDEGRLKMDEYVERMGKALEASTYGELAALHDDLPAKGAVAKRADMGNPTRAVAPRTVSHHGVAAQSDAFRSMPTALKVLWTIWLAAACVTFTVWILLGSTSGEHVYPWPIWWRARPARLCWASRSGARGSRRGGLPRRSVRRSLTRGP